MNDSLDDRQSKFFHWAKVRRLLFFITSLGFSLRLYVAVNAVTIADDSIEYVRIAEEFFKGNPSALFDIKRPPLYPLLTGIISHVFGDIEVSGRIISLIFGTLVIPVGFYLARTVYNERVALLTAIFLTIHPYLIRYSGEVLTESMYHFMTALLLLVGTKALVGKNPFMALLTGFLTALAYLVKPSAIIFLLAMSLWLIFHRPKDIPKDYKMRFVILSCLWTFFVLLSLPYILFLYKATGQATIVGKLSIKDYLFSMKDLRGVARDILLLFKYLPEAFTIPFFIFFLFYLFTRSGAALSSVGQTFRSASFAKAFKNRRAKALPYEYNQCCGASSEKIKESVMFSAVAAYCIALVIVFPSKRYLVQLMPIFLIFSAMGFYRLNLYLQKKAPQRSSLIMTVLFAIVVIIQLSKGMVRLHEHRYPEKLAGEWLKASEGKGKTIITGEPIMVYYAKGRFIELVPGKVRDMVKEKAGKDFYLAGYRDNLINDMNAIEDGLLIEIKSFDAKSKGRFVIYKVRIL